MNPLILYDLFLTLYRFYSYMGSRVIFLFHIHKLQTKLKGMLDHGFRLSIYTDK